MKTFTVTETLNRRYISSISSALDSYVAGAGVDGPVVIVLLSSVKQDMEYDICWAGRTHSGEWNVIARRNGSTINPVYVTSTGATSYLSLNKGQKYAVIPFAQEQ